MISVIVTTHNYGQFLNKCVSSILKNDENLYNEIIIIDDSSTDNTDSIIKILKEKSLKIKHFKVNFKSPSKSKNFGVNQSSSKWFVIIDADDYISNDFFKQYLSLVNLNKIDFAYSNLIVFEKEKSKSYIEVQKRYSLISLFNYPIGGGCIIKKEKWLSLGGINESLKYQDDYDFWLKLNLQKNIKIQYCDFAGYYYRRHVSNRSKNIFSKYSTKFFLLLKFFMKKINTLF